MPAAQPQLLLYVPTLPSADKARPHWLQAARAEARAQAKAAAAEEAESLAAAAQQDVVAARLRVGAHAVWCCCCGGMPSCPVLASRHV